ncbi:hypothetical protein HDV02_003168 [Globomyces sp. JEL0801]|nr:hypothetical protein HDV02_003168 [Globomyces sp. JEL0801]
MSGKYIPPHMRNKVESKESISNTPQRRKSGHSNLNLSIPEILSLPCPSRCREWMEVDEKVCMHHEYYTTTTTQVLADYFSSSAEFLDWLRVKRQPGDGNYHINCCFEKRIKDIKKTDDNHDVRYASLQDGVKDLFNRFLRYAADIDIGTGYVNSALDIANANGCFSFLDLGFAPDPNKGGNVYPKSMDDIVDLDGNPRFKVLTNDVVELARNKDIDIKNYFEDMPIQAGFDLVIVGITTSGSNQKKVDEMDELELKNLLHFSQLLLAFRHLKSGGQILIRMHLGLRLVDIHILALLLECFTGNFKFTKPLTEFAMRKTYWMRLEGFNPSADAVARLEQLIKAGCPAPYAPISRDDPNLLNNPILVTDSIEVLLDKYGTKMLQILNEMWKQQRSVLDGIMEGLTDRVCFRCRKGCRPCQKCRNVVLTTVLRAVHNVGLRLKQTHKNLLME